MELVAKLRSIIEPFASNSAPSKENVVRLEDGYVEFMELKASNDAASLDVQEIKARTTEKKEEVDRKHEKLSCLQYEKSNYERNIRSLQDIQHSYDSIKLVPEEEFLRVAPEELKTDRSNKHKLMLNRLAYELRERKRLCVELDSLKSKKKKLIDSNAEKTSFMAGLVVNLKALDDVTKPLLQQMPFIASNMKVDAAKELPRPLYTLYLKAAAYAESQDPNTSVHVCDEMCASSKDDSVTAVHPSVVLLKVKTCAGKCLELRFLYMTRLNVVSVESNWEKKSVDNSLLVNVFGDEKESPNPANVHLLPSDFTVWDSDSPHSKLRGKPFKWAQWLAGLIFLQGAQDSSCTTPQVDFRHVVKCIKEQC